MDGWVIVSTSIFFFFQAEDGIRDYKVTGVQTCALPIYKPKMRHLVITMHHEIVAILFFAVLQRLAFRVAHGKSDALRIRSPFKIAYVVLHFSDLLRFAAIR